MVFSSTLYLSHSILAGDMIGSFTPNFVRGDKGAMITYLSIQLLLSLPQFVLAAAITSESTSRVLFSLQGTLLGLEHGLFAAVRVATPILGAAILEAGGVSGVSGSCACIYISICVLFLLLKHHLNKNDIDNVENSVNISSVTKSEEKKKD